MTMFASHTPRDLNRDPEPWREPSGARVARWSQTVVNGGARRTPRPEYDHAQHNEPNGILSALRQIDAGRREYRDWLRDMNDNPHFWMRGYRGMPSLYPQYSEAEYQHARRVLARLVALEGASA